MVFMDFPFGEQTNIERFLPISRQIDKYPSYPPSSP
jgi:hypothetical protein